MGCCSGDCHWSRAARDIPARPPSIETGPFRERPFGSARNDHRHGREPGSSANHDQEGRADGCSRRLHTAGGASVRPEIPLLHEHHVVLVPPGNVQRFGWTLESWPNMIFADTPLRPYVIDSYNRRTWGPAGALLRLFLNSGVPVPAGTDPRLVEPPADYQPLTPDPIEPKWKLWKPRWQRFPKPPPRESGQVPRTPHEEEERRQRRREAGIIGPDEQPA